MAQRVFLVPETASEKVPQQMAEDLLVVSQVPLTSIDDLANRLEKEQGFLDADRFKGILEQIVKDQRQLISLARAVYNLRKEDLQTHITNIRGWREENPKNAQFFSPEAFQALQEKLPRLIRDFPCLERIRKAKGLRKAIGTLVQGVELICDLRPVFDKKRETIEGLIPFTTLKLICEGQDEDVKVIEAVLTGPMLEELISEAHKASKKLEVINRIGSNWTPAGVIEPE